MNGQQVTPASAIIGQVEVDQTPVGKPKEYFARLNGCTYVFKNGHIARFENGVYATDKKGEIDELDALLKVPGQHLIISEAVELPKQEGVIMKEVGGAPAGSTGIMNTQKLGQMAAASNAIRR